MQTIGHVRSHGQVIKVLVRPHLAGKYVALKLRRSGANGPRLTDEEAYLTAHPEQLRALLAGQVIKL